MPICSCAAGPRCARAPTIRTRSSKPTGNFDAWSGFLGRAGALAGPRYSVYFDQGQLEDRCRCHPRRCRTEPEQPVGLALYRERRPQPHAPARRTRSRSARSRAFVALDFQRRVRGALPRRDHQPAGGAAAGALRGRCRSAVPSCKRPCRRDGALGREPSPNEAGAARYALAGRGRHARPRSNAKRAC